MPDIRIQEWSPKYVQSYRECLRAVARERIYLALLDLPTEEETRVFLESSTGLIQYFALEGETVVGWCDIRPRTLPGFTHGGVLGMGVLAWYRGRGLGRHLMETCVEQAWEAGLVRIELEVFASNTIAIALYENLGFKIEGRNVRARYLDGEWAWDDSDSQRSFVEWVGFPDAIQSASEADAIERITGLKPSATVLDVGCGAGRHAIEFARRGHRVKGIDPAASFIDTARAAALDASVDVQFRVQGAVDLTEVDFYDQAFAFNHTPGFLEPNQLVQHLAVIQKSLRLCGQFLLVMAGPKMTPTWPPRPAKDWADRSDSLILSEKRYKGPYRLERNLIIDVTGDEIIDLNERQRAYSLEEITRCLESAGFSDIVAIRNLEGESATDRSFGVFLCA